jgi:hypothetical protein
MLTKKIKEPNIKNSNKIFLEKAISNPCALREVSKRYPRIFRDYDFLRQYPNLTQVALIVEDILSEEYVFNSEYRKYENLELRDTMDFLIALKRREKPVIELYQKYVEVYGLSYDLQ